MSTSGPYSIGSDQWPGLTKLAEEAAEVVVVIAKLMATGGDVHHWGTDKPLDTCLTEEIADLWAAMTFVIRHNKLNPDAIGQRMRAKLETFDSWHESQSKAPETET